MGYSPFYFGWNGYESVDFGGSRAQFWAQSECGLSTGTRHRRANARRPESCSRRCPGCVSSVDPFLLRADLGPGYRKARDLLVGGLTRHEYTRTATKRAAGGGNRGNRSPVVVLGAGSFRAFCHQSCHEPQSVSGRPTRRERAGRRMRLTRPSRRTRRRTTPSRWLPEHLGS